MISAVIFDMDGVLVDSEKHWEAADTRVLKKYGAEFDKDFVAKIMGNSIKESSEAYVREYGLGINPKQFSDERIVVLKGIYAKENDFILPGAVELLNMLKSRNVKLGLASGSPSVLVKAILDKHKLTGFFGAVISGDMVAKGKPAPDIYKLAATELAIKPNNCLAIEDSQNGVRAAKAAGMLCIAVPNEHTSNHDFSMADKVISSLAEFSIETLEQKQ